MALAGCSACPSRREQTGPGYAPPPEPLSIPGQSASPGIAAISQNTAVRAMLQTTKIDHVSFSSKTGSFPEVVRLIRNATGLPILIAPAARKTMKDEGLSLDLDLRAPIAIADLLDLMTSRSDELGWTVRSGVVEITTPDQVQGEATMRTHDVRDLIFARTEFLPPVISGIPNGEVDAGSRAGGEGDERVAAIEPDNLVQVVKSATIPDYWDTEGGGSIEFIDSGYLLVVATPEMQTEVAHVLDDMR